MKAVLSPMSVADFCQDLTAGKITVNRDYQRDDRIWGPFVRSYFIESILLEYPIPKIFLYVRYNLQQRTSTKEIVDGQQRSQALRAFFENRMRISIKVETEELRGKRYRDLDESLQGKFLSYSLSIDEFSGVSEDEIRESFARMNVHNVTLNSEELRNAKFQGPFKLFAFRMAKAFREPLLQAGVISRRDIIRMADTRLVSDAIYMILRGFNTTRPPDIDALYKEFDHEFDSEQEIEDLLKKSFLFWFENQIFNYPRLNSKHIFYTILAAIVEMIKPGHMLQYLNEERKQKLAEILDEQLTLADLNERIAATKVEDNSDEEDDESTSEAKLDEFAAACQQKTNVGHEKFIRFAYLLSALRNI